MKSAVMEASQRGLDLRAVHPSIKEHTVATRHVTVCEFTEIIPLNSPRNGRVEQESDRFSQTFTPQT